MPGQNDYSPDNSTYGSRNITSKKISNKIIKKQQYIKEI